MAFVDQGWELVLGFLDAAGNPTSRTFQLTATDTAGDISAVITDVQTIVAAWIAASDCILVSQRVAKVTVEDNAVLPTTNVKVTDNLQVSAKIDGIPNKTAVFEIPAPKIAMFTATSGDGRDQPLFSNALLANVVNIFKTGGEASISDGEFITDQNIKGRRVSHKSVKG